MTGELPAGPTEECARSATRWVAPPGGQIIECYIASVDRGEDILDRFGPDSPMGLAVTGARVGQRVTFMKSNGQPAHYDVVAVTD